MVQIACPKCSKTVPPEEINIQAALAKCAPCGAVFGIAHLVPGAAPAKLPVEMPPSFSIEREGFTLTLVRRWYSWTAWGLAFFCVFWDGFLIFWYSMALAGKAPLVALVFPLLHVGVGVFITYTCLAQFLNRTRFRVGYDSVDVRHGPVWWPGDKSVPRHDIEQLYVEEVRKSGKHGPTFTYTVRLVLQGGRKLELVSGLPDAEQARYVEQQVEAELRLADRPVAGEHR